MGTTRLKVAITVGVATLLAAVAWSPQVIADDDSVAGDPPTTVPNTGPVATDPAPTALADASPLPTDATTTTILPPPPVVIAAAGDIACDIGASVTATGCHMAALSDRLVADAELRGFLALGDQQYNDGSLDKYLGSYDLTYGRLKAITHPVAGNHEYRTTDAAGYFDYFGAAAGNRGEGWYSFDVGTTWHLVALNSNCGRVGCAAGSAQEQWLRADLAASDRPCTLAFWHHPLFSSGEHHGSDPRMAALWQPLLEDGAELVLNGHDHDYERFVPQRADGTADDLGLRELVVGTGGKSIHGFAAPPEPNSEVRISAFGYVRLALSDGAYSFDFVGEDGSTLDSGSGTCR